MEDTFLVMGIAVLLQAIKNPKRKAALKRQMLKVFQSIKAAYAGDPDFQ